MTTPAEQPAAPAEGAPAAGLTPAEQASVEKGQQGFSEPTGVNELKPEGPQRPDGVPEQFWKDGKVDVEGLAKSYGELRSKMDGGKPAEQEQKPADAEPAADANGKIEKPKPAEGELSPLSTAMEAARTEFAEKQEVSEETVASLEAAGIPKEIFGIYLQGLQALAEKSLGEIHGYADGKEGYDAMASWAAEKLTDAELNAYNDALDNPQLRENAVRGLYARYTAARPSEGKLITPSGTPSQAGDVYTDRSQLVADQRDPRYQTDAAFRQGVVEKLQRSQAGGFTVVPRQMFEREILTR